MEKKKIVVGLSGGVDSSVTAKLLVDQGHEVIGVFMKNWDEGGPDCTATQDASDALMVAQKIGIPFEAVNYAKEYWDDVFEYFLKENKAGRTPNPDILCNKYVKFGPFLKYAESIGADFIATGHYARVRTNKNGLRELCLPKDANKDQTYFLHQLNQYQLSKTLFPLADLTKPEIRAIAKEHGFVTADKKDSTGICFVGAKNYGKFLNQYLAKNPGKIRDLETKKEIGTHIGLSFYTIGQSKTLGIGGLRDFPEGKWYVIEKDFANNDLLVSQNENFLLGDSLQTVNMHWILGKPTTKNFTALVKTRYRDKGSMADITVLDDGNVQIKFEQPVRAITPGQSAVLYQDDICLGGGEIN
ncbi:tRNA 2-thiouridine(34) synthase MnmA [bacterium DOLZORAL124_38_8]|nr:MAG: tRNA 2-thiouridine(34) synthase MnmA [bacterium DOLZORAL124_38_8]